MKETMTVHQALCDAKVASKKIYDAIDGLHSVCANRASAKRVLGIKQEDFESEAKETYQSIIDLIRRSEAIKKSINDYNASHKIIVDDKEYSVAEAIYMMQHGMESKTYLIKYLNQQLKIAEEEIRIANGDKLDQAAERNAVTQFGGEKNQKSSDDYREFIKQYKEENQLILIDPLGIREKIKSLQDEVDSFTSKVDAAIQTANATTEITIEY